MISIDYAGASHLIRRMGFGAPPEDIDALVALGSREAAVDYLLNYDKIDDKALDDLITANFQLDEVPLDNTKFNPQELRRLWFTRMILTKRQFQEKLTLFWHNHFATAISKVNQEVLMQAQNNTLRANALARFDDLLLKVAEEPAMLVYLDTLQNVRGNTNENFARELQELFTMGIYDVVTGETNYTQTDITEIARTFTGWNFTRPPANTPFNYTFRLVAASHDNSSKTIYQGTPFARTANLDGADVISIISSRPSTPRFLVKKFFEFFVYPLDFSKKADRDTADRLATVYLNNDHSIKEFVRAIFTSDEFWSDRAMYGLIKTPPEFIVGPIRMLGATYNAGGPVAQRDNSIYQRSALLGMDLFNPLDVSGWDLNSAWINTASMLDRYNVANALAITRAANPTTQQGAFLTTDQLRKYTKATTKKTVKGFLSVLNVSTDKPTINSFRNYLDTGDDGVSQPFDPSTDAVIDKKIRGLVHLIMCLPEFQLN